jgi:hypothetical protein
MLAMPAALASTLILLLALAAPAAFAEAPTKVGEFNGKDVPETESLGMTETTRVAVDEASGDVYVTDPTHDLINRFDSTGKWVSQIKGESTAMKTFAFGSSGDSLAVDNSGGPDQGDVYFLSPNNSTLYALGSNGVERWEAASPDASWCGVGVDQKGDPWVDDPGSSEMIQLDPSNGATTGASIGASGQYCSLAFDNQGSVYAGKSALGGTDKYDQQGNFVATIDPSTIVYEVATSFVRNSFFTAAADVTPPPTPTVRQFDFTGRQISKIDGKLGEHFAHGVAYNGTSNLIYTSDYTAGVVYIYSVPPQPPTVSAEAASGVTKTGATINGKVNPNASDVTECHALYETEAQFEMDGKTFASAQSAPCSPAPPISGTSDVPVTASLTMLTPGTTYHTEIVAANAGGTGESVDILVTTPPQPRPVAATGAATSVGETGATLNGTVNPEEGETTCAFQYGPDESYGSEAPCASQPGSGSSAVAVSAALSGLTPGKTYHYRLAATNAGGTSYGSDATFTTATPPPPVEKPAEKPAEKPIEKPAEKPAAKKPLTRGQLLALAIKKCKRLPKHKRAACIKKAKKKYAPRKKHKKKK